MITSIDRAIHRYFFFKHPIFKTSADDVLKWAPFGLLFFADIVGSKTKSSWQRQVLVAGAAEAIKYLLSDNLKKITQQRRPAPYIGNHSFPSGHTSTSFSTAEMLRSELKGSLPVLSYSGYLAAAAVAAIRIMKNRHWLKDVVAGAAIGIVSTTLAYALINKLAKSGKNTNVLENKENVASHLRKEARQIINVEDKSE